MTTNNYGATNTNPFADEPDEEYHDDPFAFGNNRGYQQAGGRGTPSMYGDFSGLCDTISSNIFRINSNITSVDRAMKQIGTSRDSKQLRDKIHSTEQSTNFVINDTAKAFKQLSNICSRSDRQQKLQYERLKGDFQDTVQRYNSLQKKAAEKVKATMPLSSSKVPVADLIGWNEAENQEQAAQRRQEQQEQLQAQEQMLDTDLELLHEREDRIRQLEADVLDINEIFKDLGMLVHEQGETIDTIEENVENAYGNVEAGNDQLTQAVRYQRKARKKMCILVIILVIIAAIIALVIYLSVHKS